MSGLGVYIHIPFCLRKCNYCDFCSFVERHEDFDAYTDELCRRMRLFANEKGRRYVDTVYFGGGTPTLLPIKCFERLFDTLSDCFEVADDAEITVECNPATVDEKYFRALVQMGANRLSIGAQSVNENELLALGRLHNFEELCISFECARRAGFENISVDLMYGIPEQTTESFERTLRLVAELGAEHISAYGLKIEEGTLFGRICNTLALPDEDEEFLMYTSCKSILSEYGYKRYEISNFAKAGRESRHNLKYWELDDYVGFGVAAHSCVDRVRYGNSRDMNAFLRKESIVCESSFIDDKERLNEYIMLGLRLETGISPERYFELCGRDIYSDMPKIKSLADAGFLRICDGRISFSDKGFFVSNAILSQLLN